MPSQDELTLRRLLDVAIGLTGAQHASVHLAGDALARGTAAAAENGAAAAEVPIVLGGETVGTLTLSGLPGGRELSGDELETLGALAGWAALALPTSHGLQHERLRGSIDAAERERRRWARELHDETLQGLAALRVLLTSALRARDPATLQEAARDAVEQVGGEIANLRRLITELRPAALDQLGLGPAINSLVHDAGERHQLETRLRIDLRGDRLPADLETTIYRVAQEALTNVTKHAAATTVAIRVERRESEVELEVADDGHGFDADDPAEGFGLVGMRERVALAGGTMTLTSGGTGTRLRACFPYSPIREWSSA